MARFKRCSGKATPTRHLATGRSAVWDGAFHAEREAAVESLGAAPWASNGAVRSKPPRLWP